MLTILARKFPKRQFPAIRMTFDIQKIVAAKKAHRHALASRDILEKLRMLDSMRERAITLRVHAHGDESARIGKDVAPAKCGRRCEAPRRWRGGQ